MGGRDACPGPTACTYPDCYCGGTYNGGPPRIDPDSVLNATQASTAAMPDAVSIRAHATTGQDAHQAGSMTRVPIVDGVPHLLAERHQAERTAAQRRVEIARELATRGHRFGFEESVRARTIPILGAAAAVMPGTHPERETMRRLSPRPGRHDHT